ncbi:MAG: UDP-N-acetylglucosamine 1-carboxyvinyltransferase [Clostridia bacterium]|nr:UDP-N-acetylglucosamine 1-carboxyvinyltransferase [Clostridia bacterium]
MGAFRIIGGKRLSGTVKIHGAKNSVLPLISATVLLNGECVLHNCPDLSDVDAALGILNELGINYERKNETVRVFAFGPRNTEIPDRLMRKMRSSVMFLGSILGKKGRAVISRPGGCELGPRPIDIHINALSRLGARVREKNGKLEFTAENGLKGADIILDFPSVGATENIILAATAARGKTTVYNAAREPEIKDLTDFLNAAGADIKGGGTDTLIINGARELSLAEFTVMPDRIEAATYMAAAAITGGDITLLNVEPAHLTAVNNAFIESGCDIAVGSYSLSLSAPERLKAVKGIRSRVYPGFPTDAGPLIISALSTACGTSVFYEGIFENRYGFIDEIKRFNANITTHGPVAVIEGVKRLSAAPCVCTDLRGGAAVVIAALKAEGESRVGDIFHIERGYEDFASNLRLIGADITEV